MSAPSPIVDLPAPGPIASAHSAAVVDHIISAIDAGGGSISFANYMESVLYAPGLGYYSAGATKLGSAGDFITAPEISSLFGRTLARQCCEILQTLGGGVILELGAGSGRLAVDLLVELERLRCLPERYLILEVSADLRQRQQRLLAEHIPQLLPRIEWLDALPTEPLSGIVVANEVLDALPVECLLLGEGGLFELAVTHNDKTLCWQHRQPAAALQDAFSSLLAGLPSQPLLPYRTEVNPGLSAWLQTVADVLAHGVMLFIDYGYPRAEYYHPQRTSGTLVCHYRHRMHDDPFLYPGLQDISASVDFTRVAETAVAAGLDVAGFTSQAHFLLGCGLETLLTEVDSNSRDYLRLTSEVKKLTLPSEMGERFKVMALTRDYTGALRGFEQFDFRHRL